MVPSLPYHSGSGVAPRGRHPREPMSSDIHPASTAGFPRPGQPVGRRFGSRPGRGWRVVLALVMTVLVGPWVLPPASGGPLYGEIAKADFQTWATNHGGVWLHFNGLLAGTPLRDQWSARYGVRFATTNSQAPDSGAPAGPVLASTSFAYQQGRITLVGSGPNPGTEDPGAAFRVMFTSPRRWAGIHRYGHGRTLTRFLGPDGNLLHEAKGDGFQAWISDLDTTNTWVACIEIAGESLDDSFDVGHADDLIFGVAAIPAHLPYLSLRSAGALVEEIAARSRPEFEDLAGAGPGLGISFLSTNGLLGRPAPPARTNLGVYIDLK